MFNALRHSSHDLFHCHGVILVTQCFSLFFLTVMQHGDQSWTQCPWWSRRSELYKVSIPCSYMKYLAIKPIIFFFFVGRSNNKSSFSLFTVKSWTLLFRKLFLGCYYRRALRDILTLNPFAIFLFFLLLQSSSVLRSHWVSHHWFKDETLVFFFFLTWINLDILRDIY